MIFENTSFPHLLLHAALPDKTPKYSFLSQNLCGNAALPHFLAAFSHPRIINGIIPFILETGQNTPALPSTGRCLSLSVVYPTGDFEERDSNAAFHKSKKTRDLIE
jgi:hypothetical protein